MKILVVDDNPLNQKAMQLLLSMADHECDIVSNGMQAIVAVAQKTYCLVLMDIMMPIMDGIEATKEIRKSNTDLPIIAVTALDLNEYKENALAAGMNDYITKPVDPDTLNEKLAQWSSDSREQAVESPVPANS